MQNNSGFITFAGIAGCIGAILVGIGEFSLQFTPNGGIEDVKDYLYFNDVSAERLSLGHFISVLSAPLYLLGYWHLSKNLNPQVPNNPKLSFSSEHMHLLSAQHGLVKDFFWRQRFMKLRLVKI